MNKEQAISLLEQVCAIYKGTLQEHQQLQQALQVIKTEEKPIEEKSKK
jgi:hypothetical protein